MVGKESEINHIILKTKKQCSFLLLAQKKEPKKRAAKTITPITRGQLCPAFWQAIALFFHIRLKKKIRRIQ